VLFLGLISAIPYSRLTSIHLYFVPFLVFLFLARPSLMEPFSDGAFEKKVQLTHIQTVERRIFHIGGWLGTFLVGLLVILTRFVALSFRVLFVVVAVGSGGE
jgi:hypothetical protein